ncbi:MAG: GDP-L-fucose synthase [Bacteroidetes bacterium]|nr:GDP-L-fucose synthase [Bacteroidota bacterium]
MDKNAKIYIAGHLGMVGSAILNNFKQKGYNNFVFRAIHEMDLRNQQQTDEFFRTERPDYVVLAAAKVGGIIANNIYRADFIFDNIQIQNNIIGASFKYGVKKLLFLGSSCIYPKNAPQPMSEDSLLTSTLEYTNEPYAIAKIAGLKLCESFNLQYGTNFISVMPTNLYGYNDNFDLEKSHVLPALIRKMHLGKCLMNNNWEAIRKDFDKYPVEGLKGSGSDEDISEKLAKYGILKKDNEVSITLWGTGNPKREFLHASDLADACVFIMENIDFKDLANFYKERNPKEAGEIKNTHINIGTGVDLTIRELSEIVREITQFQGKIIWDSDKPDGTMRKLMDVSKLHSLGWKEKISFREGISKVYESYIN